MSFDIQNVRQDVPADNQVFIYWLCGAGFLFKFAGGQSVCIDPYLSDSVEALAGFRRLSLAPVKANELFFDLLLITHEHPDHLDTESFDELMQTNPDCKIIASTDCTKALKDKDVDCRFVSPGDVVEIGAVTIRTVPADHGDYSPEAIGFIIEFGGRSLYFTGDTAFNEELLRDVINLKPEILIPCINGAFGNLDEKEAAVLAARCRAKAVVPCHFWLFAEHGGSPGKFRDFLKEESPATELYLLTPGRGVTV